MCRLLVCFRPKARVWRCPVAFARQEWEAWGRIQSSSREAAGWRGYSEAFLVVCHMAFDWSAACMPYLCLGPDPLLLSAQRHTVSPLRSYAKVTSVFMISSKGLDRCHIFLCVPMCSCHLPVLKYLLHGRLWTFCLSNWTREFLGSVPSACLRA